MFSKIVKQLKSKNNKKEKSKYDVKMLKINVKYFPIIIIGKSNEKKES